MEDVEEAKMRRNSGLPPFLSDNAAVYAADNAFSAIAKKFDKDNGALLMAASYTGQDNRGFNQEKLAAKNAAGEAAATYCASAQVILESLGMFSISNALHDAESYFTHPADAEAASRLQTAYNILNANLATITPDYVSTEDLENLQALINTFMETGGSSQEVHALSPELTAQFKSALKIVDTDVKNILKLGKRYKLTNSTFYDSLVKICKMPAVIYRHTGVDFRLNDSVTGAPVAGALVVVSNSKTTGMTDATGFFSIPTIRDGSPSVTIEATGYATYTSLIHIVHGTENSFHILLTKG